MARETKLNIIIEAEDKASKGLKGVNKSLDNLKSNLKKTAVISTAVFAGLATAVTKSVKAFQEQEKAEARLEAIATNVTKATKEQIKALKDQASIMQKLGVVGDDVAIAGQSQLLSFGLTTDEAIKLTAGLGDLLVANKGVNATQEDAITSSNALGKAIASGLLGPLQLSGILLTDQQKALFETASQTERVAILTDVLAQNYGGLNEEMRKTSAGAMKALSNSFSDLQEKIGEAFIPVLNDLVAKLQPMVESFVVWAGNNPELIKQIILIVGGLTAFAFAVSTLSLAMTTFNPISLSIVAILALLILTIINVIKIVRLLQQDWELVWSGMKITMAEFANEIVTIFEFMVNGIIKNINVVISGINSLINKLKSIPKIGKAFSGVGNISELPEATFSRIDTNRFAPKTGGGGGATVIIQGNTFMGDDDIAELVGDKVINTLKLNEQL